MEKESKNPRFFIDTDCYPVAVNSRGPGFGPPGGMMRVITIAAVFSVRFQVSALRPAVEVAQSVT